LIRALDSHHQHLTGARVYHFFRAGSSLQRDEAAAQIKDLMRAATGLFTKTPDWASDFLFREFQRAGSERPGDPNPKPIWLNAAGRCFSTPEQVALFVEYFDRHLHRRIRRWREDHSAPGMNNWCKAFQIILRLNEKAVLHFDRPRADSLARGLSLLLEAVAPENRVLRLPYKHTLFSIYFLLRFRARPDGSDFLAGPESRGKVANRIRENLERHEHVGARLQANAAGSGNKTLQTRLLRFLKGKATVQDIIMMRKAHDETVGEAADD
jgi:hypothetical protein